MLIVLKLLHKGNVFILNNKTICVKSTQERQFSIKNTTIHSLFSIIFLASHANTDYSISIFLRQIIVVPFLLRHQIYFAWYVSYIKPRDLVLTAQNVYFSVIILPCTIYWSSHDTLSYLFVNSSQSSCCGVPCLAVFTSILIMPHHPVSRHRRNGEYGMHNHGAQ